MADQEQLEILKQGVDVRNNWRIENPDAQIDLSKTSLKGRFLQKVRLRGANLSETDFSEASLAWADLSEANLVKANLYVADLYQTDLRGANLTGAILVGAQLIRTNPAISARSTHFAGFKKRIRHVRTLAKLRYSPSRIFISECERSD
jgi:uncharacterized protein YjbI with pentapeptide repeats